MGFSSDQDETRRKTCLRYNDPGDAHALTFSCFKRQRFLGDKSRGWLLEAIENARNQHAFDIWAYVLMPEHVHLLIWPRQEGYSISDILRDIKRPVARRALKHVRTYASPFLAKMADRQPSGKLAYRFWQRGGGYDRNLTRPETIRGEMEYIHNNPVRRGLAKAADDWLWSSAGFYTGRTEVLLKPNPESFPW